MFAPLLLQTTRDRDPQRAITSPHQLHEPHHGGAQVKGAVQERKGGERSQVDNAQTKLNFKIRHAFANRFCVVKCVVPEASSSNKAFFQVFLNTKKPQSQKK